MGRPRKSEAQLKMSGTYRKDRHGKRSEIALSEVMKPSTEIVIPKEITDEYVANYFKEHILFLEKISGLQNIDVPYITNYFINLQRIRKIEKELEDIEKSGIVKDLDNYSKLIGLYERCMGKYNKMATEVYGTPLSRTRLELDKLNINRLKKELSPIEEMLKAKRA